MQWSEILYHITVEPLNTMPLAVYSLAKNRDTEADFFAFSGSPAPSKLPTLIPAAVPMPYGICVENKDTHAL